MAASKKKKTVQPFVLGQETGQFMELATAMQEHRDHSPNLAHPGATGKGSKLGEILAFVRGLRLSARLIYILRDRLSDFDVQVHWGHVQDDSKSICSPECDIIIHKNGEAARWNGCSDKECVMDFRFIRAKSVLAVISCKSRTEGIDPDFAKVLKKHFKVKNVFIFAESVDESAKKRLKKKARECGYKGFWYLYSHQKPSGRTQDRNVYYEFLTKLRKVLPKKPRVRKAG